MSKFQGSIEQKKEDIPILKARIKDLEQRLEERTAELTVINKIQQGLAAQMGMQEIYDLIGDEVREIFNAQVVMIATFDHDTETGEIPYLFEKGQRFNIQSRNPFNPLARHLIETQQPLVVNENAAAVKERFSMGTPAGESPLSMIFMPLIAQNQVNGFVSLQNINRENAFSQSDVNLLETLAASMSVALENARLFDETQRLLKETEERNAELAVINSVQEGLAAQMDIQAIYDLVGEQIRDIFDAQVVTIVTLDHESELIFYHYVIERGERINIDPLPFGKITRHYIKTRQPVYLNSSTDFIVFEDQQIENTEAPKSVLVVPMVVVGEVKGAIGLQNLDRENAFSDSDVRLLTTLTNSMSVALENARLFDETQRLLKETEQRASELATVNRISRAMVSELDLDVLLQLTGEQMKETFAADVAYVAIHDKQNDLIHFPYVYGESLETMKYGEGITSRILQTAEPLLINRDMAGWKKEMEILQVGLQSQSYLGVPIQIGQEVIGVLSVQSLSEEGRFDDADMGLLTTIAANVGVAIQNARLYTEADEARQLAEEANRAKSAFLATMSHELRTPLNSIIGFTRIVKRKSDGILPERQVDNLGKVLTSAEHLLNLINTILDIAKIEAGRMDVTPSKFDAGKLVERCVTTTRPLIKPGIVVKINALSDLPQANTDQDKIKQIVLNLLSNAAKFTHEGTITARVRTGGAGASNLIIEVTDTGIGMTQEQLERIFEEFQQADSSTTREYGGTGLGLSISKHLAQLLGGDLTAVSAPGEGATFTLDIPFVYEKGKANAQNIDR